MTQPQVKVAMFENKRNRKINNVKSRSKKLKQEFTKGERDKDVR